MRRLTISVDDELAAMFEKLFEKKGYLNRSEAFRDLVRREIEETRVKTVDAKFCVGSLTYVYNHHERRLASRLMEMQHAHHDVTVSAMHAHLDHDNCIETIILRGPTPLVKKVAESIIAQTGVRHGKLHLIPVDVKETGQGRNTHIHAHPHT